MSARIALREVWLPMSHEGPSALTGRMHLYMQVLLIEAAWRLGCEQLSDTRVALSRC